MARLFTSGFELNSVTDGVEWTTNGTTGTSIDSTTKRTGGYSMKIDLTSGQRSGAVFQYAAAASAGPTYGRAYFRFSTLPSAETRVMSFKSGGAGLNSADRIYVTVDNSGNVDLYDEDGLIATHGTTVTTGVWYRFELGIDLTPASGSDICYFRLDGSQIGATNRAVSTNPLSFAVGGNFNSETVTGVWYIDDCAINNSTGSSQTSWCGSGKVAIFWPNAAGDTAQGTRGGTDSGTDYGQVNSYNDASYYVLDANNDVIDFNVTSSSDAGITSGSKIYLVQVGYRVRDSSATGASASRARIKSQASGTVVNGTALGDLGATFNTNATAAPKNYQLTSYTDPQAGGVWTTTLLDSMQIGYQATDADPDVWISALWAYVEFNEYVTVSLNSPSDGGSTSDTTPDLVFTGTDNDTDNIRYNTIVYRQVATDDFNRADSATLGANWSQSVGGDDCQIISNKAASTTTSFDNAVYWNANSFANNQFSRVTLDTLSSGDNYEAVVVRANGSDYVMGQCRHGSISPQIAIYWYNGGAYTVIASQSSYTFSNGDIIELRAVGTKFTMLVNGVEVISGTNASAPSSGSAGISMNQTDARLDNWVGGDIIADAVSGTDAGFSGSPDNSDPFASGQAVTYTVQSALTVGNTYYWNVRGLDPDGTGSYGSWGSARSFSVTAGGAVLQDIIYVGFIPFPR